jgi:isopentenyl diphosphate isomerase/L-lactate dehydrogenase-like FMN-dependent dehydrogenase
MGSQRAFNPDGELAVARAAKTKRHLQILSTVTTTSVEDVSAARGEPVWYQLYPTSDWTVAEGLLARAERAGCPAIVLTVDLPVGSNRETLFRSQRVDTRDCRMCHQPGFAGMVSRKPMFDGLDVTRVDDLVHPGTTWEFVKRLRDRTRSKLLLKGIVTAEDAALCAGNGIDGIIVSNHGGRSEESGRATIDSLPEVVAAVRGRLPVLVDSGFRRGTDMFKALALGARAICIGRPYGWGLAAFGQAGVEAVLQILRAELTTTMRTCGTPAIKDITPRSVDTRR